MRNERGQVATAVLGCILAVILLAALIFGGWQLGWWFKTQNANREAHVIRHGFSNQQTLREQVTKNIGDVLSISVQISEVDPTTGVALKAQRKAVLAIVCQEADEVTGDPLPVDQQEFVGANCQAGVVSPTSIYN